MANFQETFLNFAIIGLAVFCIFAFVITSQSNNNVSNSVSSDPFFNSTYSNLRTNLNSYSNDSQTQKNNFERDNPTVTTGGLTFTSIVGAGKIFNTMIINVYNIIIVLPAVYFGVDPVVISVISGVLIVIIILTLWYLYKGL